MKHHLITILGKKEKQAERGGERKGVVSPGKRSKYLARRLRSTPRIRFYDLGQVNHGDPQNPFWEDHPILKTPSYTPIANSVGTGYYGGLIYELDPFEGSDFADYTDLMFNYPVTDWTNRYRRFLYWDSETVEGYPQDARLSVYDEARGYPNEKLLGDIAFAPENPELEDTYLDAYGYAWKTETNDTLYRNVTGLTCNFIPHNGFSNVVPGYFGFSTYEKNMYKVTTANDPNAPDVGIIAPDGVWDVFLMPQISMMLGTSQPYGGTPGAERSIDVWGMCYQVQPKYKWPRYIDAAATSVDTPGAWGDDALLASFMSYQSVRTGMQASTATFTGVFNTHDLSFTETPFSPSTFPTSSEYGIGTKASHAASTDYFGAFTRNYANPNNFTSLGVYFRSPQDPNEIFGSAFFRSTDPLLVAVIKAGGTYYYVWDVQHVNPDEDWGGYGNFNSGRISAQKDRFLLYRGDIWKPGYAPGQPLDGTGAFWYL